VNGLEVGANWALHMKRLCVAVVGLICASVGTVEAEDPSMAQSKPIHHHAGKATTVQAASSTSAGLGDIRFSDPYAPPVGAQKGTAAQFPAIQSTHPAPQSGGFSLTAGRDSPDAPFTGGLKFRF
jgi:hypothetical protein